MADEQTPTTLDSDLDWDDLLSPYEEEAEEAEDEKDSAVAKLAKNQRKLAEKQAKMEAQNAREKLVAEFYSTASDSEKELADVFLAGVADPAKVKQMIDLAKAKAKALNGGEPEQEEETEDEDGDDDALSAPVAPTAIAPRDKVRERAEKAARGDVHASFSEFMDAPSTVKPPGA
jgi:hypothetical protein